MGETFNPLLPKLSHRSYHTSSGEDPANDFFDGDFLYVNVADGQFVQQGFADRNHAVALDLELDAARGLRHDLAIPAQLLAGAVGRALALNGDELGIGEAVHHLAEAAIEEDRAVINDNDALAQLLDVGHVMAGEQDGRLLLRVVLAQELPHGLLGDHVQADGRLVQEQDFRLVQQRRDQLHLRALAQRKLAHADVELVAHGEQFAHLGDRALQRGGGDAVDLGV